MKLRMPEMPPANLLVALGSYNLLPAIVFLPTRRRCDEAASEAALSRRTVADDRREARRDFMRSFVEQHSEIRNHRHWDTIVRSGIASHCRIAARGARRSRKPISRGLHFATQSARRVWKFRASARDCREKFCLSGPFAAHSSIRNAENRK